MKRDCQCPRARHTHGTRAAYCKDGCRCFPCRIAHSRASHSAHNGGTWADPGLTVPRIGTIRRLQALAVVGWSEREIAEVAGVTKQAVRCWRTHPSETIRGATAVQVAAVYEALWDQPPTGAYVARTQRWAAGYGWLPPMMWDDDSIDDPSAGPAGAAVAVVDEVAVSEAVHGRPVSLTRQERLEAVRQLTGYGYSASQIADRLRLSGRTIVRTRGAA